MADHAGCQWLCQCFGCQGLVDDRIIPTFQQIEFHDKLMFARQYRIAFHDDWYDTGEASGTQAHLSARQTAEIGQTQIAADVQKWAGGVLDI